MNTRTYARRAAGLFLMGTVGLAGGCDFAKTTTVNPNTVPDANLDQLFTSIQVNHYLFTEGQIARFTSMWLQQMAGVDRQFQQFDQYVYTDQDVNNEFSSLYTGGALIDMRDAIALADSTGRRVYEGILKIHQAAMFGMAASLWGDIPYSQAALPEEYPEPQLDDQADVYAAVQTLLDEAIEDIASGEGLGPGSADLSFGGDADAWLAVAHSLKARFYLHWAEADPANYARALAEAQQGIASAAGDWMTLHSTSQTEANPWYQFIVVQRAGYIAGGAYLIDLLNGGTPDAADSADDDPRLSIYFSTGAKDTDYENQYVGSQPGQPAGDPDDSSSNLNPETTGAADYNSAMISCSETQFIIAEAQHHAGDDPAARAALEAALACEEDRWGVELPAVDPALTGDALLEEIMTQKYIALFLNIESYNDYKRTCLPALTTFEGDPIPGRLYYGQDERQSNSNIPEPAAQPDRNDNDPNPCTP